MPAHLEQKLLEQQMESNPSLVILVNSGGPSIDQ
jgi:hypothetical protein